MSRAKSEVPPIEPSYGPLVPWCKAHGISKQKAFAYARSGDLETAMLGSRKFVMLESLRTLPMRLAAKEAAAKLAANAAGGGE